MSRAWPWIIIINVLVGPVAAARPHRMRPPPQALAPPANKKDKIDSALRRALKTETGPFTILVVFTREHGVVAGFHIKGFVATGIRTAQEIDALASRKDVGSVALLVQPKAS